MGRAVGKPCPMCGKAVRGKGQHHLACAKKRQATFRALDRCMLKIAKAK